MSSGMQPFTQEPTGWSQMSFANLPAISSSKDEFSSKMNLSCWKVTRNPPYLWNTEFSLYLGKKQWILGWELQTKCVLGMDNQRNAPEPVGAWCESWELLCSQHSKAAGPVLLRGHQMFGTCCWSFLKSFLNFLNWVSNSIRISWSNWDESAQLLSSCEVSGSEVLGLFHSVRGFFLPFTHGSVKKSLLWGGLWWQKCPQAPGQAVNSQRVSVQTLYKLLHPPESWSHICVLEKKYL